MIFEIIPGIDVAGGRLVRLTAAGADPVTAFGGEPLAAARAFLDDGAEWLHVVDVDLAFDGEARNLDVVRALAATPARVQASGGIAGEDEVEAFLEAGAERVVLGSAALLEPGLVASLVERLGPAVAVGIEVEGGRIRARGRTPTDLDLASTLDRLAVVAPARLVVTAVARVGGLRGPDLGVLGLVAEASGRPVVASGGIASVEDLRTVAAVPGVEGAIVGRAMLERAIELRTARGALA